MVMSILKDPIRSDDHIQGNENALIILVEYADYQCPYCGLAYPVVKSLQQNFGDQLTLVFRNFPLIELHPYAMVASETAEFAGTYDRFWEMQDLIFENQGALSVPFLLEMTESLELSVKKLEKALEKHSFLPKIKKDIQSGIKSGVQGTPTFFINDQLYNGPIDFEHLAMAIESVTVK
jgi:protein-disulfide isomerase